MSACTYCDEGIPRVQEVLPNGEVIWAHWTRGKHGSVCHECKRKDEEPTIEVS